jgi:hypothetical protein
MKNKQLRRCSESNCNRLFVAHPKVGARQVTCGCAACQRSRHAEKCRQWHAANREASSKHYEDVVVPFRLEQPSYQRRWRWSRRLREIREQLMRDIRAGGSRLRRLMERAGDLAQRAVEPTQSGVITRESLPSVMSTAETLLAAIEQATTCLATLAEAGI